MEAGKLNMKLPAKGDYFFLNFTSLEGPLHLYSSDGMNCMCPPHCVCISFRQSDILYFSFFHQLLKFPNLPFKNISVN